MTTIYDRGHVERYDRGHFFARGRFSKVSVVANAPDAWNKGEMKKKDE